MPRRRKPLGDPRQIGKWSIQIDGHSTSYSIENAFREEIEAIVDRRGISIRSVVLPIAMAPGPHGLSSAVRVFVFEAVRAERDELRRAAGSAS